jgi:hypothetical protein
MAAALKMQEDPDISSRPEWSETDHYGRGDWLHHRTEQARDWTAACYVAADLLREQIPATPSAADQGGTGQGEGAGRNTRSEKRNGGRRPLAPTDPKRQVYERIKRERKPGERSAATRKRLEADKDFMELFKAAKVKWKTVFKNARAYFSQPGKIQESPAP